ncbi:MAG: EamA family transporter [Candidatus Micrarchaeia archaeon]
MYETVIIALAAVLSWLLVDSFSKFYTAKLGKELSSAIVLAAGVIPMLLLVPYAGFSLGSLPLLVLSGIAGGAVLFLGFIFVYKSVPDEGVSNSYILVEIQPPLLILFGILALGEHLNALQLASMLVIFTGIVMIIVNEKLKLNKKLIPAFMGNVMWTVYWIIVIIAVLHYRNFILPLLLVRIFGAIFAYLYYKSAKIPKGTAAHLGISIISLALLAGIFDGIGNTLFSFVSFSNKVAVGSAVLSLEPVIIWFVGYALYKEKITKLQKVGFAIATIGYLLLALI